MLVYTTDHHDEPLSILILHISEVQNIMARVTVASLLHSRATINSGK